MVNKKDILEKIEDIKALDSNVDYLLEGYFNEIVELLGADEKEAIEFLKELSDDDFSWVAGIYENTVKKFNNSKAIDDIFSMRKW